ncbi:hypothetical protein RN001_006034 [Aquatica leii]|uniref:MADF domain-containing protein n=1 Tax=Aquatica leii TaxID=1421715 RepID=A0AAN7P7B7_9COLE|nr:hypothetical protein RN001_006034 [Aquatica leii]
MPETPTLNEHLIEADKKYPFLFNKRERDYKNTVKKSRTSEEIALKLHLTGGEEACKKWKSLRDRYTRELKRFSDLKGTGTESQQLEIQTWDLFDNLSFLRDPIEPNKKTVTNYTPNNGSLAQATNEQSCGESTSSNHFICVEEENSSVKCSTSSCTTNTDSTPSRKVPKRKALEEINAHFMEATTSFWEMCQLKMSYLARGLSEVTQFLNLNERFPPNIYIIGDAAYELNPHLLKAVWPIGKDECQNN